MIAPKWPSAQGPMTSKPEPSGSFWRKVRPPVGQLVVGELGLAQRALQRREEMRQRLLVVPDVGAGALAGAVLRVLALPGPELAALEADHGRGAQERERGGGGVLDLGRQGRAEDAVAEGEGLAGRARPSALSASRALASEFGPLSGVVVAPGRRRACRGSAPSGLLRGPSRCRRCGKLQEMTKRTFLRSPAGTVTRAASVPCSGCRLMCAGARGSS